MTDELKQLWAEAAQFLREKEEAERKWRAAYKKADKLEKELKKKAKESPILRKESPREALARWEKDGLCDIGCAGCQPYYEAVAQDQMPYSVFQPSHKASPSCKSGKHNHCTCDTCF